MNKNAIIVGLLLLLLTSTAFAQGEGSAFMLGDVTLREMKISGPRIGVTQVVGALADELDDRGINPTLSQFGWHVEHRFVSETGKVAMLVEVIPLVAGVEQNTFLPSITAMIGMRSLSGWEVGVGPNASVAGTAVVFGAGRTFDIDGIYIPVNVAYAHSTNGGRLSLVIGFGLFK
jgi:hypothetical protein